MRSAELKWNSDEEICKVKAQSQLEIDKMNSHLEHFHNQTSPYKNLGEKQSLTMSQLVIEYDEISDFSDSDDGDFVKFLPSYLPLYC